MAKNSRPLEQLLWEGWRPLRKMRQACVKNDPDVVDPALANDGGCDLLLTSAYGLRISLCFLIRYTRFERAQTSTDWENLLDLQKLLYDQGLFLKTSEKICMFPK